MVEHQGGGLLQQAQQQQPSYLVKPKTRKGKRHLEKRGPKLVRMREAASRLSGGGGAAYAGALCSSAPLFLSPRPSPPPQKTDCG